MTAETDLLPCPFCGAAEPIVSEHPKALPPIFRVICSGGVCHAVVEGRTLVRAKLMWNRRACVSSATEALRAELDEQCRLHDVGMERELALRAEVAETRRKWSDAESKLAACDSDLREFQQRAERLAEALREIEQHAWIRGNGNLLQFVRAALNPTAAQGDEAASAATRC